MIAFRDLEKDQTSTPGFSIFLLIFLIRKSGKKSEVNFCQVATAREIYAGSAGSTMGAIESMNEAVICSLIGM